MNKLLLLTLYWFILISPIALFSQNTTSFTGSTSQTVGATGSYRIGGFECPIDDGCYYLVHVSGPPVTIVSRVQNFGCEGSMYDVTFHGCGTVVLQGLRPCQNFVPGTITITVTGTPTNASITNKISSLCSGQTYNFTGTPAGGIWSEIGAGTINSGGLYTAPVVFNTNECFCYLFV